MKNFDIITADMICASGIRNGELEDDLTVPNEHEVEICRLFLACCRVYPCGTPRHSYGLKHRIERQAGKYVSNGALILAGVQMNIPQKCHRWYNTKLYIRVPR